MWKRKILVVEDNEINREMLVDILSSEYDVITASNGKEALDVIKNVYQNKEYISLILLDIIMPIMDGYTFLKKLKNDEYGALIPVVVTTSNVNEVDEVLALSSGATDFIPKPYKAKIILHRVANIIKLREHSALINQVIYDKLTGLYNKDYFYQQIKNSFVRNDLEPFYIVTLNIENFKFFNESFGLKTGDNLLNEIAKKIRNYFGNDVVAARFNADRFFLLLNYNQYKAFDYKEAIEISKSIIIRWGVFEIVDKTIPVEQMCDRASLAVNSIKGQYNKYINCYDDNMRKALLREKMLLDSIDEAIENKQLFVYFQPKYSVYNKELIGAEALVRWNHPSLGMVSPKEFIPLFEKYGVISNLDRFVWEEVFIHLSNYKKKGYKLVPVSMNVSRIDAYNSYLSDIFMNLTKKYDIEPKYIHLEITESAYTKSPKQIIKTSIDLRKQGFSIEMDDFGSGYSSLNMFSMLEVDVIKLDIDFVQNETSKSIDRSILGDVINMAHRMNIRVVAEGVETNEQLNKLRMLNCDFVQGYLLKKPIPEDEFENELKKLLVFA